MPTPKLRFKEFDGDWKSFSLLDLSSDKTLNNGVFNDQNKVGKGYKLINVLDMYIDRDIDESRLSLLDLSKQEFERNKVKYGDIFFTRSSLVKEGIAYSNVYLGSSNDITYDGHLIKLSPNLEQINSIFLNYGLKTSKVRKQLIQGGKTATMTTIGQKEIASTKIDVPFLQEQTKIASFLSAVDEKISQLTQKLHLLGQYKQGMMKKLFSQQIRFKADDGSQFEEWVTKTIKELNLYISDGNYGELYPTSAQFVSHGVPFIRANNIKNLKVTNNDMRFIDENLHQILNSGHLKTNDIIVTTRGDIGMVALVDSSHEGSNINAQICLLRVVDQSQLSPQFLLYFLDSSFGQKQFKELQTGTALKQLPKKSLDKIITLVPSINEQTKIANFLSAIDQKIDVVSEQLEQAKLWKKGLLQQMFV